MPFMGYHVELNTLLRPPQGFVFATLSTGKKYTVTLERDRAFPLNIAILVIDADWNFYGYAVARKAKVADGRTEVEFEMLTLFSEAEKNIYKKKFIEAAKLTGEVKS